MLPAAGCRASLQTNGFENKTAHPAGQRRQVHTRHLSMIPPMTPEVGAEEQQKVFIPDDAIEIGEDVPDKLVLQDNNFIGGTKDVSIIAVQVLTLFNDATSGGGDLDLYVGLNSLNDAHYDRQNYGLLQSGQSVIGGISWTF